MRCKASRSCANNATNCALCSCCAVRAAGAVPAPTAIFLASAVLTTMPSTLDTISCTLLTASLHTARSRPPGWSPSTAAIASSACSALINACMSRFDGIAAV
jgi:hypothetical protein